MSQAYDPSREELFHVAGDADHGVQTTALLNKSAIAKPEIRYTGRHGDFVLTADVYRSGDGELLVHILCPNCGKYGVAHALHIKSAAKHIEWSEVDGLSVEPFGCTWELPGEEGKQFGLAMCNWRVRIDRNIARDA